jgi:hypothetical protein
MSQSCEIWRQLTKRRGMLSRTKSTLAAGCYQSETEERLDLFSILKVQMFSFISCCEVDCFASQVTSVSDKDSWP